MVNKLHKRDIMKKKSKIDLESVHSDALAAYEMSFNAEKDEREKCLDDMRFCFVPGAQWEDTATTARSDRPRFEINKVIVPVNNAIGEQRQNRISIKARAGDGGASKDVAETLTGLIRNIESKSHFNDVKDTAYKEIVSGGIGAWCVTTEYEDKDGFDQTLKLKAIKSAAASVFYDSASKDELKRDAQWIMVTQDMGAKAFKKKYPEATIGEFAKLPSGNLQDWQTRDTVRIADYWVKEPCTKHISLMSDGQTLEMNDENKSVMDELMQAGVTVVNTRRISSHKVVMYKLSAHEVLSGPHAWAGEHIPVVPIFGFNVWIDGMHYYNGMVRHAKDPQRVYNYATSQAIETSALSPKDPYWLTTTQAQNHEAQFANFNVKNNPFMFYNADPEAPGAPQRTGAPSVQQALISQVQQADMDIQATTGQYSPSLGDDTTDQSGRAILALQKKSNTSTFELLDNLAKAVEWTGEILIDLIPKIYDTERQVSILGEDGTTEGVVLNQQILDQETGQPVILNDLSTGKYSVTSTVGPTYATQRAEQLNVLSKLSESNPLFGQLAPDLMAQSMDFPFGEELTKRVRAQLIQQGAIEPNEEEAQLLQSKQPQPTAMDQIQFKQAQLALEQQAALIDNLELQNKKIAADIAHKYSQTRNNLTDDIETKVDINDKLLQQGNPNGMPIEEDELKARSEVLREMNEALELDGKSVAQMNVKESETVRNLEGQGVPPEGFVGPEGV